MIGRSEEYELLTPTEMPQSLTGEAREADMCRHLSAMFSHPIHIYLHQHENGSVLRKAVTKLLFFCCNNNPSHVKKVHFLFTLAAAAGKINTAVHTAAY